MESLRNRQCGDLGRLFAAEDAVKRWRAERENADARLQLAQRNANAARLISQHEPVESIGVDRERLRCLLRYVAHGDMARLLRDIDQVRSEESAA